MSWKATNIEFSYSLNVSDLEGCFQHFYVVGKKVIKCGHVVGRME